MDREILMQQIKRLIIEELDLRNKSEADVADDAPLFGGGLGLDSLDALVRVLERFVVEGGRPRRFAPTHPGFSLGVRRGKRDFARRLWVVPSTIGGGEWDAP